MARTIPCESTRISEATGSLAAGPRTRGSRGRRRRGTSARDVGALEGNNRAQTSIGLSDVVTLSPSMVITAQAGFTRWTQQGTHPSFDQSTIGISPSLISQMQQNIFPRFNVADIYYIGASEGRWYEHTNTFSFNLGASKNWGSHNMKFGFQSQVKQNNSQGAQRPGGEYNFTRAFTQPNAFTPGNNLGNGIASFLLGTPASGLLNLRAATAPQSPFYGWYFQDDFKVTSKLTLNFGLRYDLMLGITERYDQNNLGFDLNVSNPIEAAAKTAYARSPIPELPASNFNVRGGLFFATKDNRRNVVADKTNWQPRIGLAYRVLPRTVIRTGYGIFYSGWWQPFVNATGFSAQTDMVTTLDGGLTPADTMSNPFPNGLVQPTGASLGMRHCWGRLFPLRLRQEEYSQRPLELRVPARGTAESAGGDQLRRTACAESDCQYERKRCGQGDQCRMERDGRNVRSALLRAGFTFERAGSESVPGLDSSAEPAGRGDDHGGATLDPYPAFGNINLNRTPGGKSHYHSLQVSGTQRFAAGAMIQFAYTFSKQIEQLRYIEASDPAPSKMIGQFDNPHRFSTGIIYEIPVGQGLNAALKKVVGGWQWSAMYIYQTGAAVALPAALATGVSPELENRSINNWFNGASMAVMPAFTARRNPYFWSDLRGPALNNWDMGFIKNTTFGERFKLQFRTEMINAFNRVWFGGLSTAVTAATYTQLTGQSNAPRNIQLGLKLSF